MGSDVITLDDLAATRTVLRRTSDPTMVQSDGTDVPRRHKCRMLTGRSWNGEQLAGNRRHSNGVTILPGARHDAVAAARPQPEPTRADRPE
jgi:hypothetical protein